MVRKRLHPRSLVPRTLRGRLVTGLVALLAAACATVGLVTYIAVSRTLLGELDSQLGTASSLAYSCGNSPPDSGKDHNQPPGQAKGDSDDHGGSTAPDSSPAADSGTASDGSPAPDSSPASGGSPAPDSSPASAGSPAPDSSPASAGSTTSAGSPASDGSPAPDSSPASDGGTVSDGSGQAGPSGLLNCTGLGSHTFVALLVGDHWTAGFIPNKPITLSAADQHVLLSIEKTPVSQALSGPYVTTTRYLSWAQGTYRLTAIEDPDGDGNLYITGLPLSGLGDFLSDVAIVEVSVFIGVLLFAGVLGFYWIRFSLRPLRRVAVTASQVAELPLDSGEVSLPVGVPDTDPTTETGQVGLAFNRMLGHVERSLRRRAASEARLRRFAADASHELRTPLAAIRGYAELALLHPGKAPEEVTHALGRVLSESQRMSVLVDDLLLLARLDAGRPLSREPVDMTRLAIEATSDIRVARPGHRWMLELPDDPETVLGDEHRLRQVLGNLLSNAGRHTPDGTTVTVRVSDELPDGEPGAGAQSVAHGTLPPAPRLVVSVTDNGPGIPGELLPDLFERFTRADTSRSHAVDASSTGLGLAIVDAVVAAHHGAVLVTSRPGITRFTIVLARLTGSPAPAEAARESQR